MDESRKQSGGDGWSNLAAVNQYFPDAARREMGEIVEQIARTDSYLARLMGQEQSMPLKVGFAAEQLHTESFNLRAILEEKAFRAYIDKHPEWKGSLGLSGNDTVSDIVVADSTGKILHRSQSKYYGTPEKTANAMRQLDPNTRQAKYTEVDSFVGPKEQIRGDSAPLPAGEKPSKIEDYLDRTANKFRETRPGVSEAASDTHAKVSDRLQHDGIESDPLSTRDVRDNLRGEGEGFDHTQSQRDHAMLASTTKQMMRAAGLAAAVAAVASGVQSTCRCLALVKEGKMTREEAVLHVLRTTTVSSADAAVKAGAATGAVSVARALHILPQQLGTASVSTMVTAGGIAGAAIVGADLVVSLVNLAAGKTTVAAVEERFGKNVLQTSAGVWGSAIGFGMLQGGGAAGGMAATATTGAATISVATLMTAAGPLAGGMIAGLAVTRAIELGIERPFRELIQDTELLQAAQEAMNDTAQRFALGQQAFEAFVKEDQKLDSKFQETIGEIDATGQRLNDLIDEI